MYSPGRRHHGNHGNHGDHGNQGNQGNPAGYATVMESLTKRREKSVALRKSEQKSKTKTSVPNSFFLFLKSGRRRRRSDVLEIEAAFASLVHSSCACANDGLDQGTMV